MGLHSRLMSSTPRERGRTACALFLATAAWVIASFWLDPPREGSMPGGCLKRTFHLGWDELSDRCHSGHWIERWDTLAWISVIVGLSLFLGSVMATYFMLSSIERAEGL